MINNAHEMSQSYPSVQSFYKREILVAATGTEDIAHPPSSASLGDGFTEQELADATSPLNRKWNPEREYEERRIVELEPGPLAVRFVGRVVNFSTFVGRSSKESAARGWQYVGVRDEGGVCNVSFFRFWIGDGGCLLIWW